MAQPEPQLICRGCFNPFGRAALSRHIAQTSNPSCRFQHEDPAVLDYFARRTGTEIDSDEESAEDDEGAPSARRFEGDYFGANYTAADFGLDDEGGDQEWAEGDMAMDEDEDDEPEPGPNVLFDSDSDSEESSLGCNEDDDAGWEAPSASELPGSSNHGDDELAAEDAATEVPSPSDRARIEAAIRQRIHITRFPSSRAGCPIPFAPGSAGPTSYRGYEGQLRNTYADGDNVYAPFTSRIEWEIAHWAKLRGRGSTAVSDLLSIEGVSLIGLATEWLVAHRVQNIVCSYKKSLRCRSRTRANSIA